MAAPAQTIGASQLVRLLAQRHSGDVFVPECKDGPTQTGSHLRMDAWAMPRSWSKPWVHGYEIKVTRADFLSDDKWPGYLPLCNSFWFVAPPNTIQPDELPPEAGLLVATKTGTRLLTKKKAPVRQIEIPEDVFRYVLMCRTEIRGEYRSRSRLEFWRQWLAEKAEKQRVGYEVSKRVCDIHERLIAENVRLKSEMAGIEAFRRDLEAAGVEVACLTREYSRRRELERVTGEGAMQEACSSVIDLRRVLRRFADAFEIADDEVRF